MRQHRVLQIMVVKALACFFWKYWGNLRCRSVTNDTLRIFVFSEKAPSSFSSHSLKSSVVRFRLSQRFSNIFSRLADWEWGRCSVFLGECVTDQENKVRLRCNDGVAAVRWTLPPRQERGQVRVLNFLVYNQIISKILSTAPLIVWLVL